MKFNGQIPNQERNWSRHAARYNDVFLDPYATDVVNPLWQALDEVRDAGRKTAADLGCGTGPLLGPLLERFRRVVALDFAPGMIDRRRSGSRRPIRRGSNSSSGRWTTWPI